MNQNRPTWSAFLIVFCSVISALIIGTIFGSMDIDLNANGKPGILTYFGMFIAQIFLIVPLLLLLRKSKLSITKNLRINKVSKRVLFYSFILSVGAIIISDEINIIFENIFPLPESFLQLENILKPDNFFSFLLLSSTVVLIAPIGEELLFRGFLQQFLEKSWGDITRAVLVSSLLFAFIHFNPYWVIQIYLLGILLGYMAWRTGSVLPSIIFHISVNGSSLLFTTFDDFVEPILLWKGHINPILILTGILFFRLGLKNIQLNKGSI